MFRDHVFFNRRAPLNNEREKIVKSRSNRGEAITSLSPAWKFLSQRWLENKKKEASEEE